MNELKVAEKKASQLVSDARRNRVDRMKEAKTEAEQIIAAYRSEMEKAYQSKLSEVRKNAANFLTPFIDSQSPLCFLLFLVSSVDAFYF